MWCVKFVLNEHCSGWWRVSRRYYIFVNQSGHMVEVTGRSQFCNQPYEATVLLGIWEYTAILILRFLIPLVLSLKNETYEFQGNLLLCQWQSVLYLSLSVPPDTQHHTAYVSNVMLLYRVIKKSLCTRWLQYRKLQVMFKVLGSRPPGPGGH
jgi:hypothetical protein